MSRTGLGAESLITKGFGACGFGVTGLLATCIILVGEIASAQPKFSPSYTATVQPITLTYVEKIRRANRPPPAASTGGGKETKNSVAGEVEGVGLRIDGYKAIGGYTVGGQGYTVWVRDNRTTAADDKEFDGACTASWTLGGVATVLPGGAAVNLVPSATPYPPTCVASGIAVQMPDFQQAFNRKVAAEVGRVLVALKGQVALGDDQRRELQPKGTGGKSTQTGAAEQIRSFNFFDQQHELHIQLRSVMKFDGALGVVP